MFANAEMARAKTERGAASKLPPGPPPLTREPLTCAFASNVAGLRGNDGGTARFPFDLHYAKAGCAYLIHAGKTFYEWRGDAWEAVDMTALSAIAWGMLKGPRSKKRVDGVLYALKLLTHWPRPPVLFAPGV